MTMTSAPDTVAGEVMSVNEKGLKLRGEESWRNFSKFANGLTPPERGAYVVLKIDNKGFIREIESSVTGSGLNNPVTTRGEMFMPAPSNRDRTITRLAVLKAAANFCGHYATVHEDVKADHVLRLAEKWIAWVERDDAAPAPAAPAPPPVAEASGPVDIDDVEF